MEGSISRGEEGDGPKEFILGVVILAHVNQPVISASPSGSTVGQSAGLTSGDQTS